MATTKTVTTDQSNDRTIIPCPIADPASGLANNELIIWMDDASNTLRMAGQDDSGTAIAFNSSSGVTTSIANDWTGQQNFIEQTLTDAASIAWNMSTEQNAQVTITANRVMDAPTNLKAGGKYALRVVQDGTGGRTLTYNAVYKFDNSILPLLDTTAGASTILNFYSDGTNLYLAGNSVQIVPMNATAGDILYWDATTARYLTISPGAANTVLKSNGSLLAPSYGSVAGTGDVVGPATASNNGIAVFNGTTGEIIKDPNADISAGTQKITNVVDPTSAQDAATKNYVDTAGNTVMALIDSVDISTAKATHTFSSLDGDVDMDYIIKARIVNALGGVNIVYCRPNNDATTSNYAYQNIQGAGGSASATQVTTGVGVAGIEVCATRGSGLATKCSIELDAEDSSYRLAWVHRAELSAAGTVNFFAPACYLWDGTGNITSIVVTGPTDVLGVGTRLELWALR